MIERGKEQYSNTGLSVQRYLRLKDSSENWGREEYGTSPFERPKNRQYGTSGSRSQQQSGFSLIHLFVHNLLLFGGKMLIIGGSFVC